VASTLGVLVATTKAGFDLLLIGHVTCTIIGFGALVASGIQAERLSRSGPADTSETIRRYFAPGFNWAGRVIYGVPVFGFLLLADSGGHLRVGDPWVVAGLALWAIATGAAETLLWPAERRIQSALVDTPLSGTDAFGSSLIRDCRVVAALGAALAVVFVAATVLMVARPR
jgi:uncharacterized membrane protein